MKLKRRRNSVESEITRASRVFEDFHGAKVNWVQNVEEQYVFRPVHALLGELRAVWVAEESSGQVFPVRFSRPFPSLVVTPDARSLYVVGGDQEISLKDLGMDPAAAKDRIVFGPLVRIEYKTTKDFHDFEPTIYLHDFGSLEDGNEDLLEPWQRAVVGPDQRGPVPLLSYDTLNRRFSIDGGAYSVKPEGIVF